MRSRSSRTSCVLIPPNISCNFRTDYLYFLCTAASLLCCSSKDFSRLCMSQESLIVYFRKQFIQIVVGLCVHVIRKTEVV
jgi:hypothetical protein